MGAHSTKIVPLMEMQHEYEHESVTSHTNTVNSHFTAANLQRAMQLASEQSSGGGGGMGRAGGGLYSTTFGTTASGFEGGSGNGGSIMLRYVHRFICIFSRTILSRV